MSNANAKPRGLGERVRTMLLVDTRRALRSKLFYIMLLIALLTPVVMTVMMSMMDGATSTDPQTGVTTTIHGPENTWQQIGTLPTEDGAAMGGMDVMAMCNINMVYMGIAVFVCIFISDDFKSGFSKNLFTTRAKKDDYVISKTVVGFAVGALMLACYFVGAVLGGAIAGLSFEVTGNISGGSIFLCMLAKIFLMLVFVPIFTLIGIAAKQKTWLSICGSLGGGMLLFMMIPMITPLESTLLHVVMCMAGGALFAVGFGYASRVVLDKTSLLA